MPAPADIHLSVDRNLLSPGKFLTNLSADNVDLYFLSLSYISFFFFFFILLAFSL